MWLMLLLMLIEFKSVIAFRQHHKIPRSFNQSDLYFLCRMTPITYDITPCPDEVVDCQWMKLYALSEWIKLFLDRNSLCES